jgi:maltose alpha-D-glucosyltransferase/alpha-amylase
VGWSAGDLEPAAAGAAPSGLDPKKIGRERDTTAIQLGDRYVLKLVRRLEEGVSPEVELGRFLAERGPDLAPKLCGGIDLLQPGAEPSTLATLHAFVPHSDTGWRVTIKEVQRYFERALAHKVVKPSDLGSESPRESVFALAAREPPPLVAEMIGAYQDIAAKLGSRVAELHLALTSPEHPAFAPEEYSTLDLRSKYQSLRNLHGRVLRGLRGRFAQLPARSQGAFAAILAREKDILTSFEPLLRERAPAVRIRTHGNLHLGHVLFTGKDFVFTDLGDFRALSITERRRKRSPLRDLAWMVRSFERAALTVFFDQTSVRESDMENARPWAQAWMSWVSAAFVRAYARATEDRQRGLLSPRRGASAVLFEAFLLERALYDLQTAVEDETQSVAIPLFVLERMLP